jgi:hypothetical protein
LSVRVSNIIINGKYELQQGISYQGEAKVVASAIKTTKFNVRLEISLEDKVLIIIIAKLVLKWMRHEPKFRYKIFR